MTGHTPTEATGGEMICHECSADEGTRMEWPCRAALLEGLDQARHDANQSRALVAAADLVIGRQAAQLERQAATITALRERIAAALDIAADPDRFDCCEGCRIEAITDTLNGLTDQAAAAAAELDWMSAD